MYTDDNSFKSTDDEQDILRKSVTLINSFYDYFGTSVQSYQNDISFIHLDQWTADLRSARSMKRKQILTINYLHSYCAKVIGEEMKNDPSLQVRPDSNELTATSKHATLLEGLLRKIFIDNNFSSEKTKAFSCGVFGGYGVLWVNYEYESPYSFHKKITIKALTDPTQAFFDAMAEEDTKCDGDFCGYFKTFTHEEFHKLWPKARSDLSFKSLSYLQGVGNRWGDRKTVKVAYLWKKERYSKKLALLSNGETLPIEEAEEMIKEQKRLLRELKKHQEIGVPISPELLQEIKIEKTRISNDCYKIKFYKMVADEILSVEEWPSQELPGIFVDHDSLVHDNQQYIKSYHRKAQDVQRYLNYLASQSADAVMNMHHGSWLANEEQLPERLLNLWLTPQNDKGILLAARDSAGAMPQYEPPPQISPAFDTQYQRSVIDLQNILGQFDAGRGQHDNAISGKAINYRAMFGNLGSFIPLHHLENAILQCGKVILSLIPAVYDNTRTIGIRPKHGDDKQVKINMLTPTGKINDMSNAGYRVMLENGLNFEAQKMAGIEQLKELIQNNPQLAPLLSDLIAQNLDLPNGAEIVNRVRMFLLGYPVQQILAQETGMQPPPPQPNPMAQLEQAKMQNEMAKTQNEKLKIMSEGKRAEQDMQLEMLRVQNEQGHIDNQAVENEIRTHELMNEAAASHGKTIADLHASRSKIIDAQIRANAEIQKALLEEKKSEVPSKEK